MNLYHHSGSEVQSRREFEENSNHASVCNIYRRQTAGTDLDIIDEATTLTRCLEGGVGSLAGRRKAAHVTKRSLEELVAVTECKGGR